MAGISSLIADQGRGDPHLRIDRAPGDQQRLALAVLLTGLPREEDPAVDQFLQFAREQTLDLGDLWLARHDRRPVAAALLVTGPGSAAMLFHSPIRTRADIDHHAQLLRTVCQPRETSKLRLIQSLLDPHQRLERQALESASFEALAVLVYMQRAAQPAEGSRPDQPPSPLDPRDPAIQTLHYTAARRDLFARAIQASYEQTLDCPRLLGVRSMDDIIDGHMATGEFNPRLWHVFVKDDEPVGVMLLASLPAKQAVELVYLGVSLPWRGRGLARRMMTLALDVAARAGASSMLLAVDEQNTPALRLYRSLAFRPTARKTAMIRTISKR